MYKVRVLALLTKESSQNKECQNIFRFKPAQFKGFNECINFPKCQFWSLNGMVY